MSNFMMMLVLCCSVFDPTDPPVGQENTQRPRPFHEINRDIRTLLRRDVQASSNAERARAVVAMTRLYQQIRRDPRLSNSKTLQGYKAKLWGRLQRVKDDIRKDISRSTRLGEGDAQSPSGDSPNSVVSTGDARGGRAVPDWGPGLVALIERTIAPDFWDVNGGPGTIVYYYPLQVIVVRATSEIHHQVGGGLEGLRGAGR